MDNHTAEACEKRKPTENDANNSKANTSRNDKQTSYHCCITGHFKADCIHFKHARDQRNQANTGTASAMLATAGHRDVIWLAENSTPLTAPSAPAAWVIDSRASHHICNNRTRFNSIKKHRQPTVMELIDDNKYTVSHHGLVNVSQDYKVNGLHTPTIRLSLLSIHQLDTAGYTSTVGVALQG